MGFDKKAKQDEDTEKETIKPVESVKEEPKKEVDIKDILFNHEQRIVEMEAKWFRLGGI